MEYSDDGFIKTKNDIKLERKSAHGHEGKDANYGTVMMTIKCEEVELLKPEIQDPSQNNSLTCDSMGMECSDYEFKGSKVDNESVERSTKEYEYKIKKEKKYYTSEEHSEVPAIECEELVIKSEDPAEDEINRCGDEPYHNHKGVYMETEDSTEDEMYSSVNKNMRNGKSVSISSSETQINSKSRRRKHNCIFCETAVHNFSRHLERKHADQTQVQKYLHLSKNDLRRKKLIDKLRKEGDFRAGNIVPVQTRQPSNGTTLNNNLCKVLPCIHCKGYYARVTLRKHVKHCFFNNNKSDRNGKIHHQSEGHTLMADHFRSKDPLRTSGILKSLRPDEVSLVAKKDRIICEMARKYIKSHKVKFLVRVVRRNMRRLARLVIEARKIENDKAITLLSLLNPKKFKLIVQATKAIWYDHKIGAFKSPTMALQMGILIKTALDTAFELETDEDLPKLTCLAEMKKLVEKEWYNEISREANLNLTLYRIKKTSTIPKTEDSSELKEYSEGEEYEQNDYLNTSTQVSSERLNNQKKGEKRRITRKSWTQEEKEVTEQYFKNHIKMKTPPRMAEVLNLIGKYPNVFGERNWKTIKAYVFNQYKKEEYSDESNDALDTCNKADKYDPNYDVDTSSKGDDHKPNDDVDICSEGDQYELNDVVDIRSKAEKFEPNYDEDTFSKGDDHKPNDNVNTCSKGEEYELNDDLHSCTEDSMGKSNKKVKQKKGEKGRITRKSWSREEKEITEQFFKNHIKMKTPPRMAEVLNLIGKYPNVFGERNWKAIKAYVFNQYKK